MRVGFPGGPRLEWYDRNPSSQVFVYMADEVAPHVLTVRFTYTVPTGKKAFVEVASAKVIRFSAATTSQEAEAQILFRGMVALYATIFNNNIGAMDGEAIGEGGVLAAGEQCTGRTVDGSTLGTMDYRLTAQFTEFNA